VATVVVSPRAIRNLERLIETHAWPGSTRIRFALSIEPLGRFPKLGAPLSGHWAPFRFILGPWRWMIVVYEYDEAADRVAIVTIQDGRSARAATSDR
jgi:plasmid stabilization system protein ParE